MKPKLFHTILTLFMLIGIFLQTGFAQPPPKKSVNLPNSSIQMEFVLITSGTFRMGSPGNRYRGEHPVHTVEISRLFYLGKYPVTQAQWTAVMGSNPSKFKGSNRPVEGVSWYDAQKFIRKLNAAAGSRKYRLPTEAEWEYAARAGSSTVYSFGNDSSQLRNYAWYVDNSNRQTHPVGQLKPNKWGLYDMLGNVMEWVQDWYSDEYYQNSPARDPKGPRSGSYQGRPVEKRVARGGGWYSRAEDCRCAYRFSEPINSRRGGILGFRLLMVP